MGLYDTVLVSCPQLDAETRDDLLGAVVDVALAELPS